MSKPETAIAIVPQAPTAPTLPYTKQFLDTCEGLDMSHPDAGRVAERTFVKNVGSVVREAAVCAALAQAERTMNDPNADAIKRRTAQLFWTRNSKR